MSEDLLQLLYCFIFVVNRSFFGPKLVICWSWCCVIGNKKEAKLTASAICIYCWIYFSDFIDGNICTIWQFYYFQFVIIIFVFISASQTPSKMTRHLSTILATVILGLAAYYMLIVGPSPPALVNRADPIYDYIIGKAFHFRTVLYLQCLFVFNLAILSENDSQEISSYPLTLR